MTNDIKKAIEEEVQSYQNTRYNIFAEEEKVIASGEFRNGALFTLSKWEESTRWRKVEEELPEIEKVWIKCTIHLPNNKTHVEYSSGIIYSKTDYNLDNKLVVSLITTSCKVEIEWKPIH